VYLAPATKIISLQLAISFIVGCSLPFQQLSSLDSTFQWLSSTLSRMESH